MKRDKIIYWISTGVVAAFMLFAGVMYITQNPALMETFKSIGIPTYIVTMLGVAKLLGAIVLVAPVWTRLKEWAYAGFAFVFIGAAWTHVATGTPVAMPLIFLVVLGVSYLFRYRLSVVGNQ